MCWVLDHLWEGSRICLYMVWFVNTEMYSEANAHHSGVLLPVLLHSLSFSKSATPRKTMRSTAPASVATTPSSALCPNARQGVILQPSRRTRSDQHPIIQVCSYLWQVPKRSRVKATHFSGMRMSSETRARWFVGFRSRESGGRGVSPHWMFNVPNAASKSEKKQNNKQKTHTQKNTARDE